MPRRATGERGTRLTKGSNARAPTASLCCWRGGVIPDVDEAVDSPMPLTRDPGVARRLLELAPRVPTAVWGRDELGAGEMWNSNSVIAWLLARAGLAVETIGPPAGGRAPEWSAGLVVAARSQGLDRERDGARA